MSWGRDPCNAGLSDRTTTTERKAQNLPRFLSPSPYRTKALTFRDRVCCPSSTGEILLPLGQGNKEKFPALVEARNMFWAQIYSWGGKDHWEKKPHHWDPATQYMSKTESSSEKQRTPCLASSTRPTGIERQRTGWQCGERLSLRLPKGKRQCGERLSQGEDLKLEEQTLIFKTLWQTMLILNTKITLEEFKVCGALRATTAIINLKPLSIPD